MNAHALAYKPRVTVVDVLDAGACIEGVKSFIQANGGVIVAETAKFLRKSEWIAKAANAGLAGNGYGDGYGNGYGYGDGYGDGNGNGW